MGDDRKLHPVGQAEPGQRAGDVRLDDGLLDWIARTTLKGEQTMTAAKQKEREAKLAKAGRR